MSSNRFRFDGQSNNGAEYDRSQNWVTRVPRPLYHRMGEDGNLYPWRLFEERVRTGPFGLSRFPMQPFSPVRILILDGGRSSGDEGLNPRLRRFIQNSPPRIRSEWNVWTGTEEPAGLTEREFKAAMKRLKKQAYQAPKKPHRRGLFGGGSRSGKKEIEMDGMPRDCMICLEAFVANEQVLVTPCKHMFHEDCITPWVRSHGKCPICRLPFFDISTRSSSSSSANNNNTTNTNNGFNVNNDDDDDDDDRNRRVMVEEEVALQLVALIRAMEEAFNWVTLSRAISFD